jgi:hypothetical protein
VPVHISTTASAAQLLALLERIDISVPARIEGRTTDHTETWTICHLLSSLANARALAFPVSLQHRDRPDFCLSESVGTTGIEVTEAISEQYAAYSALAEREFPDVFLEPAHFRWNAKHLSLDEMRELLRQDQLTAEPWVGDRPEQEWALFMQSVIEAKLAKMKKPGFALFPRNVLAIYDNLPLPNVYLAKALTFLTPLLASEWSRNPSFDTIYIEHGPVLAEIASTGTRTIGLHDIWP